MLLHKVAQLSVTLISHFNFERCIHLQSGAPDTSPTAEMGGSAALAALTNPARRDALEHSAPTPDDPYP